MPATLQQPPVGAVLRAPDLDDPSSYRVHVGVPILPAKEQPIVDPKTGKAVINPKTGKPATIKWNKDELQRIADNCNERTNQRKFIVPQIGHSDLTTKDERAQPKGIGLYRNWRIGPLLNEHGEAIDSTPHLIADELINAEDDDEASTFPHRSPQMNADFRDPGCTTIDSVALLRRPPRHEMGHTVGPGVIFNARDAVGDPDNDETSDHEGGAADPFPLETEAPETGESDPMPETMNAAAVSPELMQAISDMMDQKLDALLAAHAETGEPAPEETPVQNDATAPGGSNTFAPGMGGIGEPEDEAEVQNCGDEKMKMYNARISDLETTLNTVLGENKELRAALETQQDELGGLLVHNQRQAIGSVIDGLIADGVKLEDREDEITRLLRFEETDRPGEIKRIKLLNARSAKRASPIPVVNGPAPVAGVMTQEQMNKATAHAGKHGVDWSTAKAAVLAGSV